VAEAADTAPAAVEAAVAPTTTEETTSGTEA
jgi:hypothetical protein